MECESMKLLNHVLFSISLFFVSSVYAFAPPPNFGTNKPEFKLPDKEWRLISLPVNPPGAENTVKKVFGDDISGHYGTDWALFEYNARDNQYKELTETDSVVQGKGYWIIQVTGREVILDLPSGTSKSIPSIPLVTPINQSTQWNLLGFPFAMEKPLNVINVKGNDICTDSCDLDDSEQKQLVHNNVWVYDGNTYVKKGPKDNLKAWDGFWIPVLSGSSGHDLSLVGKKDTQDQDVTILHGGKPDNSGDGSYYPWDDADAVRGLVFDAHQPFVLKSVKVYNQAGQAATRTFTLYDDSYNEITHKTVAVPEGEHRIQLDMKIPAGSGYKLMADVHKGLYRNNNASYPFQIGSAVTVTGSDINQSHYYFFYDWEIAVKRDELGSGGSADRKVKYSKIIHENLGFRDFHVNMIVNVDELTADNIQSAIDRASAAGGGVVRLLVGEGRLDHTINMRNNVKLIGSFDAKGRRTRLIPTHDIGTMIRGRKVNNIIVENIIFDERGKEVYPLHFGGGGNNNLLFKNNVIINAGIPKLEHANVNPSVRSENHEYITGISFYSNGEISKNITVEGNYFANLAEHATEFRYVDNAVYNNNVVRNAGSGGETTTGSSNIEILNNDISDVLEGYKIYGSHNVVMHNNATHDNPITSYYDSYNNKIEEEGGGKGLFLQKLGDDSNIKIFDNYFDGDLGPIIRNNARGYSLKNNRSSEGKIEEMTPDFITHSVGSDVFGSDPSHPLPVFTD